MAIEIKLWPNVHPVIALPAPIVRQITGFFDAKGTIADELATKLPRLTIEEFRKRGIIGDYKSHDLLKAMNACKKYDLIFSKEDRAFVEKLAPFHKDFAFRYPEKLEQGDLGDLRSALKSTKNVINDVDVGLKIKGYNSSAIAETLPKS